MPLPVELAFIFQPIVDIAEAVIKFFHENVGLGWGLSIVFLTFLTRALILPLSITQIRSMRAMQAYAPQIKELQERYKDDKERQQRELIGFYKENKINPLASCIPLLLQLPVFISLYHLLRSGSFTADVLSDSSGRFLFVSNLTEKANGAELIVLIILFITTQMAAGLVMSAKVEGTQRLIMFGLPIFFAPFIATTPAGLAVYWISTNTWTLGQQFVVQRFFPAPEAPTVDEIKAAQPPPPPPRKKKKRR